MNFTQPNLEKPNLKKIKIKSNPSLSRAWHSSAEMQKIFFFLPSRYDCAIFSAAFKKF